MASFSPTPTTALPSDPVSQSGEKRKSSRIFELDALRALAALNLLLFHFTWVYSAKYGFESPVFGYMFPFGKYGVQMFFMLSGFVNAFTLLRKKPTATDFVAGRAIRILPLFWLVVILNVFLLSSVTMFGQTVSVDSTVANMSVMPMLFGYQCMEPVTWTLMIEILFYGFLLIALFTGRLSKPMLGFMIWVLVGCLVGGFANQGIQSWLPETTIAQISAFIDELLMFRWMPLFAMGILLNEIKMKRGKLHLNVLGILFAATVFHLVDVKDHNPLATAVLFGLLLFSAYGRIPVLRFKPLLFIGSISYPLYLFHNNIGTLVMSQLESIGVHPFASFLFTTALVIAMSAFLTFYFERPISRFLGKGWSNRHQISSWLTPNWSQPHA